MRNVSNEISLFRRFKIVVHALLITIAIMHPAQGQSQASDVDPALAAALQAALDEQFAAQSTTGLSAAISMPDGTLWTGTSGFSDPPRAAPIQPEMRFGFASITKTYVAAVVLQLIEEGVLTLDDKVSQWLPSFTNVNPDITIRHMLGHTSGIYNFTNHPNLWTSGTANLDRVWAPEEILNNFVSTQIYPPGAWSGYSNTNYILLGMIIKAATGTEVGTQLRNRLLAPNHLNATFFGGEEAATGEVVTAWTDLDNDGVLDDYSDYYQAPALVSLRWTAGGMFSTPTEIAQWARILYTGSVLSPSSLTNMLTFRAIVGTGAVWTGYGFGAQQYMMAGTEFWGHSGGIRATVSLMVYSPEYDISIAIASNDEFGNHFATVPALFKVARDASVATATEAAPGRPEPFVLRPAYPNPFTRSTTIAYHLSEPTVVRLTVHDILGRTVRTLADVARPAGTQSLVWDGRADDGDIVAPGVYFFTLQAGARVKTGKLVRMR